MLGRVVVILVFLVGEFALAYPSELTIGLVPEQNVFEQLKRYKPLGAYLGVRMDCDVEFVIFSGYSTVLKAIRDGTVDGAFLGSFATALAIEKLGVEPLARPVWLDGSASYRGLILVRKEAGIHSVKQMKGRRLVFVDSMTFGGYIFPLAYLRRHGVEDPETYFQSSYFAGSHDAAIQSLLDGKAEVGCSKNTIFFRQAKEKPEIMKSLEVLAESPEVPSNALAVRKDLPDSLRSAIRATLMEMENRAAGRKVLSEFGALRFMATTKGDYSLVKIIATQAGIDLDRYKPSGW